MQTLNADKDARILAHQERVQVGLSVELASQKQELAVRRARREAWDAASSYDKTDDFQDSLASVRSLVADIETANTRLAVALKEITPVQSTAREASLLDANRTTCDINLDITRLRAGLQIRLDKMNLECARHAFDPSKHLQDAKKVLTRTALTKQPAKTTTVKHFPASWFNTTRTWCDWKAWLQERGMRVTTDNTALQDTSDVTGSDALTALDKCRVIVKRQ